MSRENGFKKWLEKNPKHKYSSSTINQYLRALRNAPKWFNVELGKPLLEMNKKEELDVAISSIKFNPNYSLINENHSHGAYSAAIGLYEQYIQEIDDYTWIDFYSKFADKLLEYKNNRSGMIDKIVHVYEKLGIKLPELEIDGLPEDMDPFTVFGLFNKGIIERNRIAIIKEMDSEFNVGATIPQVFPGVPILNNLKANFYLFKGDRRKKDIDNLWVVFETALRYSEKASDENKKSFAEAFDKVMSQNGIRWNITIGLFWIRPYDFLSLDSSTRSFLKNIKNMPDVFVMSIPEFNKVPSGDEYINLCEKCKKTIIDTELLFSNFPELSEYACSLTRDIEYEGESENGNSTMGDCAVKKKQYWIYNLGESVAKWDNFKNNSLMTIGWSEIGDLSTFASKDEIIQAMIRAYNTNNSYKTFALAAWQFVNEINVGDIIFVRFGDTVVGRGIVTGEYTFNEKCLDDNKNTRTVEWTHTGEWQFLSDASISVITNITQKNDHVEELCALFDDEVEDLEIAESIYPIYSKEDFLSDVYMNVEDYDMISDILLEKKNIILQGAPGVGKTFAAKRLVYSIMGEKNPEHVQMVQFHQSYSYEDFIEGYRPADRSIEGADFVLRKGVFYKFCKRAEQDRNNPYFFIIDEINRGNLNKIFGELFMLIESDKREVELQLLYSGEKFSVPENIRIIGLMNTADRSLAMMDYALRRRFAFFEINPGFDTDGFCQYQKSLNYYKFDKLIEVVKELNRFISDDLSLGKGFRIGHSFFCNLKTDTITDRNLYLIVEFEILPLIREYWFDDNSKVSKWENELRRAIK